MARFYHVPMPKDEKSPIGGHIISGQNPDFPKLLQRPRAFGGGSEPLKAGAVTLSLSGWGWWQIGPGEYVDLPEAVTTKIVKDACPQLRTKAEAVEAGLANEDGSLVRAQTLLPAQVDTKTNNRVGR